LPVQDDHTHIAMSNAGLASRRECERWIAEGRVVVNGTVVSTPGFQVDLNVDKVLVDGNPLVISTKRPTYLALHKPPGILTTVKDWRGRTTVMDCVPKGDDRLVPIGRLDKDSEGLILLTNDYSNIHKFLHPSMHYEKEYIVYTEGRVTSDTVDQLRTGVTFKGDHGQLVTSRPAVVELLDVLTTQGPDVYNNTFSKLRIVLTEGKKRQIRRMLLSLGYRVFRLIRVRVGPISLQGLSPGKSRELTFKEVKRLVAALKVTQVSIGSGPLAYDLTESANEEETDEE